MALTETVEPAGETPTRKWGELATRSAIPLHFVAFSFGLPGLLTAQLKSAIGLSWLLRALDIGAAFWIAIVAWAPTSWGGVIVSAGLQGISR